MIRIGIREHRIADFAQVVLAFKSRRALPRREEHGDENGNEHPDDGDDDQKLDKGGAAGMGSWSPHERYLAEGHFTLFSRNRHVNISRRWSG